MRGGAGGGGQGLGPRCRAERRGGVDRATRDHDLASRSRHRPPPFQRGIFQNSGNPRPEKGTRGRPVATARQRWEVAGRRVLESGEVALASINNDTEEAHCALGPEAVSGVAGSGASDAVLQQKLAAARDARSSAPSPAPPDGDAASKTATEISNPTDVTGGASAANRREALLAAQQLEAEMVALG